MVAATVRTEQPAPEHIITRSHSSSVLCLPSHPSLLSVFVFFSAPLPPHFLLSLDILSLYFSLSFLPPCPFLFSFLVSFFHLQSKSRSTLTAASFPCPVIGRCVILGAVNNSCCRVEGRAAQ